MMKRKMSFILVVLFVFSLFVPYKAEAEDPPGLKIYNIKMFTDDIVLSSPINEYYYWLEIKPGIQLSRVSIHLWYSCSETIIKDVSSLTVSVNGRPLASRHIAREGDLPSGFAVQVPLDIFKTGMNEIKITTTQRSIEKTCQDVDNKANWVVLHKNSVLHLEGVDRRAVLSDYPYPFINHLALSPVNAELVLPADPDERTVEAMLKIASDWGYRLKGGNFQNLRIVTGDVPFDNNQILLAIATDEIKGKGTGYLRLDENNNFYRLQIKGSDDEGLKKAAVFLSSDFIKQAENDEMLIREYAGETGFRKSNLEKRSISLKDLGYGEINLAGAFHQRTMITVKRPPGWTAGTGSYVELYFRHSTLLNPERSAVTVYINGRPLRSTALNAGNAEEGVLKVEIPEDELDKSVWNIEFAFYHDIGMADCSKRYEEVAWSVIEDRTRVYLTSGKKQAVLKWADFPNFNLQSDGRCALWLPQKPNDYELALAFLMAARMGQVYGNGLDWKVYLGQKGIYAEEKNWIVISRHDDTGGWNKQIADLVFVKDEEENLKSADKYNIPSDYIEKSAVCQVIPGKGGGITYFMSVPDVKGIQNLVSVFASPEKMSNLTGEVVIISPGGKIMNINASEKADGKQEKFSLQLLKINISQDKVRIVYLIILGLAFVGTLAAVWLIRRKNR